MTRGDDDNSWGSRSLASVPRPVVIRDNKALATTMGRGGFDDDSGGPTFNFMHYWYLLVRHARLVASTFAGGLVVGLIVTMLTTPLYRASTTIQIDPKQINVIGVQGAEPVQTTDDRDNMQTQLALLQSRSLAERVVDRLNLADNQNFGRSGGHSIKSAIKRMLGRETPVSAADRAAREKRAAAVVMAHLTVEPVRGSRLVRIEYDDPNPATAARVSNAIADNFIGSNLDRRFEASSYARKFLEDRIAQIKAKLEDAERQLVAYAAAQKLITVMETDHDSVEATASSSLTGANLVEMNNALAKAREQRIMAEQKWREAQTSLGSNSLEIMQDPTVQALRAARGQLEAQYQQKLAVYKADYPDMVQLRAQMDAIDGQIALNVRKAKDSLRSQYQVALRQEQAMQGQVDSLTAGVIDQRGRSIQYDILQREVDTNRTLYDGLLQRYKEIGVAGDLSSNNISIVDRAEIPHRPFSPSLLLNLAISGGIALLGGLGAALLLESMDETIKTPDDIEAKLGIPLLGAIPLLEKGMTTREALLNSRSMFSEAYYSVRTALQFSTSEGVPANLLISSARPAEGKSTTAAALATNFAKLGMRVLLVDGDLRNPSLHRAMGCENTAGLSNYLTGRGSIAQLVQPTEEPGLVFMSCGPLPPNPAELLAGAQIRRLFEEAREHFDLMVIDGPPVMGLADAPLLASVAEGTVIVVEAGHTKRGLVATALRRLEAGGARVLGAVLTKFDASAPGYGYHDYGYSYDYGAPRIQAN
jgi:polysaccharide biosynthesis transport protein